MSELAEWREIAGWPRHWVSNEGEVKGPHSPMRGSFTEKGYVYVTRSIRENRQQVATKKYKIHRLVALAFLGPAPEGKPEVAHGDGNPANNRLENLRWASSKENTADCVRHGTFYVPLSSKLTATGREVA